MFWEASLRKWDLNKEPVKMIEKVTRLSGGKENDKCKEPEIGTCVDCSYYWTENEMQWTEGNPVGDEVREESKGQVA